MFLTILAFVAFSIRLSGRQREQGWPAQEAHEVEVRLILVDVIATKGGEFFPGLTKFDFELFEDGVRVSINSCDLISLGTPALKPSQEKAPVIPDIVEKKRLAVLFDGINAWDREFKKAAEQISNELAALAKSGMEVMILFLDNEKGLRIIQPFTDQESLIKGAAGSTAGGAWTSFLEYCDYDDLLFLGRYTTEDEKKGGTASGGDDNPQIIEMRTFEHSHIATNRLTRTMSGILASLYVLEPLPGRKNLLFVSNGIPDLDTFKGAGIRSKIDDQFTIGGRIRIFDPFGMLGKSVFETGEEVLKEIIQVANDRNISIYSVDPGTYSRNVYAGAAAEYFDRETAASQKTLFDEKSRQMQNLRMISEKTGAVLLRGANKVESLGRVVKNDLSCYYQLSYYPTRKTEAKGYHRIEVKLKGRRGIEIRTREGYSDSSLEQSKRLVLAKAFYNHDGFLDKLPFRAEFVPFFSGSGRYQPWMSLALPAREFFINRSEERGDKPYEFHFWIKKKDEWGRVLSGNTTIPFQADPSFRTQLESLDYLRFFFAGPGLVLPDADYQVILALFDPATGEVGTWSSIQPKPFSKQDEEPAFINAVLGNTTTAQDKREGSFGLDGKDGTLEFDRLKFSPKITGRLSKGEDVHVFFQVYNPANAALEPEFKLIDMAGLSQRIVGTKTADFWDKSSKVCSRAYKIDFENTAAADYVLSIEIPSLAADLPLKREIRLSIF